MGVQAAQLLAEELFWLLEREAELTPPDAAYGAQLQAWLNQVRTIELGLRLEPLPAKPTGSDATSLPPAQTSPTEDVPSEGSRSLNDREPTAAELKQIPVLPLERDELIEVVARLVRFQGDDEGAFLEDVTATGLADAIRLLKVNTAATPASPRKPVEHRQLLVSTPASTPKPPLERGAAIFNARLDQVVIPDSAPYARAAAVLGEVLHELACIEGDLRLTTAAGDRRLSAVRLKALKESKQAGPAKAEPLESKSPAAPVRLQLPKVPEPFELDAAPLHVARLDVEPPFQLELVNNSELQLDVDAFLSPGAVRLVVYKGGRS